MLQHENPGMKALAGTRQKLVFSENYLFCFREKPNIYYVKQNEKPSHAHKHCSSCLYFQQTQPKERIIYHEIPGKLLEVVGADMFILNNKNYISVVDYLSKFPAIK